VLEATKDPYVFDLLELAKDAQERGRDVIDYSVCWSSKSTVARRRYAYTVALASTGPVMPDSGTGASSHEIFCRSFFPFWAFQECWHRQNHKRNGTGNMVLGYDENLGRRPVRTTSC